MTEWSKKEINMQVAAGQRDVKNRAYYEQEHIKMKNIINYKHRQILL